MKPPGVTELREDFPLVDPGVLALLIARQSALSADSTAIGRSSTVGVVSSSTNAAAAWRSGASARSSGQDCRSSRASARLAAFTGAPCRTSGWCQTPEGPFRRISPLQQPAAIRARLAGLSPSAYVSGKHNSTDDVSSVRHRLRRSRSARGAPVRLLRSTCPTSRFASPGNGVEQPTARDGSAVEAAKVSPTGAAGFSHQRRSSALSFVVPRVRYRMKFSVSGNGLRIGTSKNCVGSDGS